ncbi:TPA: integrating conjugative element protein [Legionella pneumophila]|uniref:Integrating conjugative element protein, PFL_4711 family n=2 Tax=Legionellaceae TaxID=444 RepID=A0A377GAZ1_9GAMM|nr:MULTISPECIES: integrating conjugative element protein [Legionellaceae]HAT9631494.1 integrating conjugative element protein [Legionella pneumophila subsp. pneumophila]KTC90410.1 Tfp pilus assembly, pilus retraction ATPase PilT [Fluoribacter dumoffii NY 23]KTD68984.1 Tfp pilus assembly, pilus retraction ATPase PilT [Legionella steelei]MCW8483246.1 integrating conjugative element protein [Fluoribacter dumoffii]STO21985.1 integrating conjugative element protein, PFL_4711 family [Fluoribacter du
MHKLSMSLLALMLSKMLFASSFMPNESDYYYKLGGSSNLYVPPVNNDQTITIGGNVDGRLGFTCNGFNPVVSITNTFQDMKSSAMNIPGGIIDNLKGSVAGFPLYKLQQSMPALYNVLQNTASYAQNEFSVKVKDCQDVKKTLEEGQSPMESMLSVSDSQGWLEAAKRAKTENVDVTATAKSIAKKRDEYGLPWIGRESGNAGGAYQRPIKVINDVVIAGYNILLNRKPLNNEKKPDTKTPMTHAWPTPDDASQWAVKVLGDIHVSTATDTDKTKHDAKAGIGLSALLQNCDSSNTCTANVSKALWNLVDKQWPLTEEKLKMVSASNLMITDEIIITIQRMPREEQILTVSKLAEEIAVQNMLDKALMMRRILQAGLQVQEVQNLKPALDMVKFALKKLDDDIHSLAFESEVRKKMMTETLGLLMDMRSSDIAKGLPGDDHEQSQVKNGAVYAKPDFKGA